MTKQDLMIRNRKFVLDVLNAVRSLPDDRVYDALVRQLVRCSTSIGANYRAACKAKSEADFVNKLKITEEEPMKRITSSISLQTSIVVGIGKLSLKYFKSPINLQPSTRNLSRR